MSPKLAPVPKSALRRASGKGSGGGGDRGGDRGSPYAPTRETRVLSIQKEFLVLEEFVRRLRALDWTEAMVANRLATAETMKGPGNITLYEFNCTTMYRQVPITAMRALWTGLGGEGGDGDGDAAGGRAGGGRAGGGRGSLALTA